MTQVTIKIELNNLDKAMTEVKALETYIKELAKTYPTTFPVTEDEKKPAPKRTKAAQKPVKETKEVPEPVKEEKAVKTPPKTKKVPTLPELTALAKEAVAKSDRETVKAVIVKHGAAKLSAIDEANYPALKAELEALVG